MIHQIHSAKSFSEIEQALRDSAARNNFGVIAVHDLKETMRKKGVDLHMQCHIFEVCNPQQAKHVLEIDGSISTALPCRISVYGSDGDCTLATMLPTAMMKSFDRPGLERVAEEVEHAVLTIMQDAAT